MLEFSRMKDLKPVCLVFRKKLDPIRVVTVERVLGIYDNAIVSMPRAVIASGFSVSRQANKVSDVELCISFYVHATPPICG